MKKLSKFLALGLTAVMLLGSVNVSAIASTRISGTGTSPDTQRTIKNKAISVRI